MKTSGWTFGARGPLIFILFNLFSFDIEPMNSQVKINCPRMKFLLRHPSGPGALGGGVEWRG